MLTLSSAQAAGSGLFLRFGAKAALCEDNSFLGLTEAAGGLLSTVESKNISLKQKLESRDKSQLGRRGSAKNVPALPTASLPRTHKTPRPHGRGGWEWGPQKSIT